MDPTQAGEKDRPAEEAINFEKHVKLEVCCPDAVLDQVIEAVEKAAHTGLRGDGLICVTPVENAIRIGTGKGGNDAC